MIPYKTRFLIGIVCFLLVGFFLVRTGIEPVDGGPMIEPALQASASDWNFLPLIPSQIEDPLPTTTRMLPTNTPTATPTNTPTATPTDDPYPGAED